MLTIQDLIEKMKHFWAGEGCLIAEPYDLEKGAGTMNPETFLRVLGPKPYASAYVEPCRRPRDGRYGENPQRVEKHHQFQVIMKPSPDDIQERYLRSLEAFGIVLEDHDLKFEEDNWEAPTLGAWGVGWQVMLDGTEITQFTYFQQAGGFELKPVTVEITYGIERLCMFLNGIGDIYDLPWNERFTYGDMRRVAARQFSVFDFEEARTDLTARWFEEFEAESRRLVEAGLYLPAYDFCLKASHAFNILDARGAISVAARADYIKRVRRLACACAEAYLLHTEGGKEAARG
ncbi:MAG: glycine--tRNA ligase subunit alpha [Acidobacteriota bacterium]